MAATNPIRVTYAASATGAQTPLSIDWRDGVPSGYSYEVQFDGVATGSVTLESTLDDINDASITPVWIAETGALTSDTRGVIGHPVVAVRLNIGSLASGTLTLKLLGGSVIGDVSGVVPSGGGGASSNVNLVQVSGVPIVAATAPVPIGFYNPVGGALLDPTLPVEIVGSVAAGATDSGKPVKVGGVFNTVPTAVTAGQRADFQTDGNSNLRAKLVAATASGADGISNTNTLGTLQPPNGQTSGVYLGVMPLGFNGSTWDRMRLISGYGDGSSATGAQAVGMVAYNGTNFDRVRLAASNSGLLVENGPYVFGRVTGDGQIKGSAGFIHTITITPTGSVTAGVLTVYNSLTETGTVVASFALPVTTFTPFSVILDVACSTGIFVGFDGTLANVACTVSYR